MEINTPAKINNKTLNNALNNKRNYRCRDPNLFPKRYINFFIIIF
jgi:hypothetical protein